MIKIRIPKQQRFVLDGVPWERYTRLLHGFSDRHLRITYDRGILEIMTLSHEHEGLAEFLGLIVFILTQELKLHFKLGGSTTFRKRQKKKGLEPDKCYWIANAAKVRGKKKIDLRRDPPPDLAIEVDITHSSLNRMGIYASLRVPEVWRYDGQDLAFMILNADGEYIATSASTCFRLPLTPADLMPFIRMRDRMDEDVVINEFREWLRRKIQP